MSKDKKTLVVFNNIKKIVYQPENWVTKEKFCFCEVTFKVIKDYGGTIISDLIVVLIMGICETV